MNNRIHFIGSEGVSMKMLKSISEKNGYAVSGSDLATGGHDAKSVTGAGLVVYSAAIKDDNPELTRARELGIPTATRAEFLGKVCGEYEYSVAVSGSHGKTTTTAMLWEILRPLNPTVHIGGNYNGQIGRAGGRRLFITEACEYKRSFLTLLPDIAVILNVDLDHTDCYKNIEELQSAFLEFAQNAKRLVVYNGDESEFFTQAMQDSALNLPSSKEKVFYPETSPLRDDSKERTVLHSSLSKEKVFYPETSPLKENSKERTANGDFSVKKDAFSQSRRYCPVGFKRSNHYYATCISPDKKGRYSFCVYERGHRLGRVSLNVAGRHNVYNALAAIAVSRELGLSLGRISAGLSRFSGAERRMEFLGYREGCAVFSDYAHHPKEIAMTLVSARESCYKHITAVFEPHTYTRTQSFFTEFSESLKQADRVVLVPIYPARELPIEGVDSRLIAEALKQKGIDSLYFGSYGEAEDYLKRNLKDDGILLFMGAGSIDTLARRFVKNIE